MDLAFKAVRLHILLVEWLQMVKVLLLEAWMMCKCFCTARSCPSREDEGCRKVDEQS